MKNIQKESTYKKSIGATKRCRRKDRKRRGRKRVLGRGGEAQWGNALCAKFNEQNSIDKGDRRGVRVVVVYEAWRQVRKGYFGH